MWGRGELRQGAKKKIGRRPGRGEVFLAGRASASGSIGRTSEVGCFMSHNNLFKETPEFSSGFRGNFHTWSAKIFPGGALRGARKPRSGIGF